MVLAVAAAVVTVPIREGKVGEVTSLIIAEGAEGGNEAGRESTGEGEDHIPHNLRRSYFDYCQRGQALASWEAASLLPPYMGITW